LRKLISGLALTSRSLKKTSDEASAAARKSTNAVGQIAQAVQVLDHVRNAVITVAATTAQNAATAREAARSTQRLAFGIAEIVSAAQALRLQAEQLEGVIGASLTS
jgi:hypothetical protein